MNLKSIKRIAQLLVVLALVLGGTNVAAADPQTCAEFYTWAEGYMAGYCAAGGGSVGGSDCWCTEVPGYGIIDAGCNFFCVY